MGHSYFLLVIQQKNVNLHKEHNSLINKLNTFYHEN